MEKLSNSSSREMQCIGKLEIASPKKPVGFLCGSIPVPTDNSFHSFSSDLVPSSSTVSAPRYRMLPTETDLNNPPLTTTSAPNTRTSPPTEGVSWDDGAVTSNLARKGEALAVSGLVEYGDEIDVIAPADILKQIFKIPYTKARLSIAVHRVGQTLILNAGPDVEEGERFVRRNQPKCSDESLFLNFAKHSVRMEACDCPPTHSTAAEGQSKSSVLPDPFDPTSTSFKSSEFLTPNISDNEGTDGHSDYSKAKQDGLYWESKKNRNKARDPIKKATRIGEKPRGPVQESEKYRCSNDEFLRVLFWQFHNFRVLLGSDLLLFSNDKYVSVSLHLWDVSRQVTPLTWLEAWLDNIMASVPEVAICYHRNGVVKGYELLKTDDIFLLKGMSEDGTPAFHPYVVQQNGLSVLRFLQANCKQDPGAYWLYKNAGEDVIQLFDLSVIPQNHPPDTDDGCSSSLPSLIQRGRSDSLLSLGTLLYRTAHRLSLSMAPESRFRCARFVRKCLELLDEPDHLVVRAFAHEQFARLILNNDEEIDLAAEVFPLAAEVTVTDQEEESLDIVSIISESSVQESSNSEHNNSQDTVSEASGSDIQDINISESNGFSASDLVDAKSSGFLQDHRASEGYNLHTVTSTPADVIRTIADPISSKLAAVHHVSQAIKSLRWTRQLQGAESEFVNDETTRPPPVPENFSVCACGDTDCIEVCDIREWLPTSKLDHKLWKLILLLGESYLSLGQAYRENGQLLQTLKVVEVACSVYGSVPQYLQDAKFISSMGNGPVWQNRPSNREVQRPIVRDERRPCMSSYDDSINPADFSSTYLFWAKAWMLVGDIYVDFLTLQGKETSPPSAQTNSSQELKMSSEVVKELIRLKKKLGQDLENCSTCSLVNCSCQNDRASSGISASSSNGDTAPFVHSKRQSRRSHLRNTGTSLSANPENHRPHCKVDMGRNSVGTVDERDSDSTLDENNMTTNVSRDDDHVEETIGSVTMERTGDASDNADAYSSFDSSIETSSEESPKFRSGGIFKYLQGPGSTDTDSILSSALICYESASKSLVELSNVSHELQSVLKKIGWVCNELGRLRLERKNLAKAEVAFAKAIDAFREVSDYTNIILINCNLGHGKRALAEEMVSKMEYFKSKSILRDAYMQALEAAKVEYGKSLRFYGAAKSELSNNSIEADDLLNNLRTEVYTQFAHTYLRLGMLLAREDTVANVHINGALEDKPMGSQGLGEKRTKKGHKKSQISANDAIREALSIYESLGDVRKQEAAYAYFQLACYQRDSCLKFSNLSHRSSNQSKNENGILQRVKQYLSLAERNWQKAVEYYSAKRHPTMYLTILIERAALLSNLHSVYNSYVMLETALTCLLEGRYVSAKVHSDSSSSDKSDVFAKFWRQLQMLLKKMLASSLSAGPNKTVVASQAPTPSSKRFGDSEKLKELYKMSLKSQDFHQLQSMNKLWAGITVQDDQTNSTGSD
ncbi:uncharacterized protein LOC110713973 isoform X2 [Chenopodium quinoa]|uniref:EDRF1 N-terminal domain-containing protein n=1 Tax=Chenopodium quinoa TaxID=63459 RepID=A0A803L030_CHEQI|nr:uncharacterized protein LOC110713973 isoform X2 [Chenopodium quinoa]